MSVQNLAGPTNYDGILTFKSIYSNLFLKKPRDNSTIEWNGQMFGPIDHFANKVSTLGAFSVFYTGTFYFMLQKYDQVSHQVEILKAIFGIPTRLWNLCTYKRKTYFMFQCSPDEESDLKISKIKLTDMTDDVRFIGLFHWILGVKAKMWIFHNQQVICAYSRGPYEINFAGTNLNKTTGKKYLPDLATKSKASLFFNDELKLEMMTEFLSENRTWYLNIVHRLALLS